MNNINQALSENKYELIQAELEAKNTKVLLTKAEQSNNTLNKENDDLRLANGALAQDNSALQREVEILNDLLKRHERNNDQSN